jgi:hypothetical protein
MAWLWYGYGMVIVWFWHGYCMHGSGMVMVWLWYGYDMVVAWSYAAISIKAVHDKSQM